MAEYTPTLDEAKGYYLGGRALLAQHPPHPQEGEAEFDRILARVHRDAAREALDGLAATHDAQALAHFGLRNASRIGQEARIYRDTHYPETED